MLLSFFFLAIALVGVDAMLVFEFRVFLLDLLPSIARKSSLPCYSMPKEFREKKLSCDFLKGILAKWTHQPQARFSNSFIDSFFFWIMFWLLNIVLLLDLVWIPNYPSPRLVVIEAWKLSLPCYFKLCIVFLEESIFVQEKLLYLDIQ